MFPAPNTEARRTGRQSEWPWAGKSKRRLKFWTNFCLVAAVSIGMSLAILHGGNITSALAWSAAALGAGSFLGFLFGIPGHAGRRIIINQPGVAAVDTGIKSASGTSGVAIQAGSGGGVPAGGVPVAGTPGERPSGGAPSGGTPGEEPRVERAAAPGAPTGGT